MTGKMYATPKMPAYATRSDRRAAMNAATNARGVSQATGIHLHAANRVCAISAAMVDAQTATRVACSRTDASETPEEG
jgi:hypothetical protein